tara:strand:- start:221 stop:928 length:708 start_codon:yes stop_codon:yes gene_type:complete
MMERRLIPFKPKHVYANIISVDELELQENFESLLGFKPKSKQYNFLTTNEDHDRYVIFIVDSPKIVKDFTNPHLVACAFGTYANNTLELWHIGIFKTHPFNDNGLGRYWGTYGLVKDTSGAKIRWKNKSGKKLTQKNHEKFVFGSANPYAVAALYMFANYFPTKSVVQNSEMPCAQLFHANYDHAVHPAIQLLYKSLGFVKSPLGNYVWYEESMPPLKYSLKNYLQRMSEGLDAS